MHIKFCRHTLKAGRYIGIHQGGVARRYTHAYIYIYIYIHTYIRIFALLVYTHIHMYLYIYIYIHVYTHIHIDGAPYRRLGTILILVPCSV